MFVIILAPDAGTFGVTSKAVGVKMKRDGRIIRAPVIVSAAGIYNTVSCVFWFLLLL